MEKKKKKFDQSSYVRAYNKKHYARICLQVPPHIKEDWQKRAKAEGKSLTAWLISKTEEQ